MSTILLPSILIKQIRKHSLFTKDKKIVIGRGQEERPEFLIIGEAPGKKENLQGEPFIGRAGKVLDHWIKEAKVQSFYISNVVPLIPLSDEQKIRPPSKGEITGFDFFIKHIIETVKPKYLITLGDSATWALTKMGVSSIKGKLEEYAGMPLTGIYHPARYIRKAEDKTTGVVDFKKAVKLLRDN